MRTIKLSSILALGTMFSTANCTGAAPLNFAVALFDGFDSIDVIGPLNPLFYLSLTHQLNLALVAPTLDPVWVRPADPDSTNSSFWFSINPTHTYDSPPEEIDVLLIPGGQGARLTNVTRTVNFVREMYPKVKYLITTCTGAAIAADSGVLDGKRATTSKWAWDQVVARGPNVEWVSPARWVRDGNIWSSSGVTAGLDLIFSFMEEIFGKDDAKRIQGMVEYVRNGGPCDDPFSEEHGVPPSGQCEE